MGDDRSWWPFAVPALAALVLVTLAFVTGGGGATHKAQSCPSSLRTSVGDPWVPKVRDPVDTEHRLAPERRPTAAVVCAYAGSGKIPQPSRKPLTGRKELRDNMEALVDTVAYLPRKVATQAHCPVRLANADDGYYLLGLTYADGMEWITASQNLCSPTPTTNGRFDSSAMLWVDLRQAYRSGSWPTPDPSQPCAVNGLGRTGQETALVPDGVTSVDICKWRGSSDVAHVRRDGSEMDRLVATLNSLPTSPMTRPGGCFAWYGSPQDDVGYRLVFHYEFGADTVVQLTPTQDCQPPISNGSLQSSGTSAPIAIVEELIS